MYNIYNFYLPPVYCILQNKKKNKKLNHIPTVVCLIVILNLSIYVLIFIFNFYNNSLCFNWNNIVNSIGKLRFTKIKKCIKKLQRCSHFKKNINHFSCKICKFIKVIFMLFLLVIIMLVLSLQYENNFSRYFL